jgi:hypothetical protein
MIVPAALLLSAQLQVYTGLDAVHSSTIPLFSVLSEVKSFGYFWVVSNSVKLSFI